MKPETHQKLITLYRNWCGKGRGDSGLPFSLADLLHQAELETRLGVTLEQLSKATSLPVGFLTDLHAAVLEGVSDEEMRDLAKVQVPAKRREDTKGRKP
jgi:hypothetical protein